MKQTNKSEEKIYEIILEKSRLNREKSMLILNKSLLLYFTFLFIGVMGFVNGFVERIWLNALIIMGLSVLVIGILPYIRIIYQEEKKLDNILKELKE